MPASAHAGSVRSVLIDVRVNASLGVPQRRATIAVPTPKPVPGAAFPPRRLMLRGVPVFELNLWCGTCPAIFHTLNATQQADLNVATEHLNAGLDDLSTDVIGAYGKVLPESTYTLLLTDVLPQFTEPGGKNDYFMHEQVATWGVDPAVGTPEDPRTPYYRTFETPVGTNGHLYEILVPMVPPSWNNDNRIAQYAATASEAATAVAYSLLDVLQPALDQGEDY